MIAFITSLLGGTVFSWIKDILGVIVQVLVSFVQLLFSFVQFVFSNFKGVMLFVLALALLAFIGYYFAGYWGSDVPMSLPFGWEW